MYLVSIIIPVYNAEIYLQETLESVLKQTYSNWECIIIDDDSTDNSKNVAIKFLERDKRFYYYHQKNAGASAARNRGFQMSKGDYIQYLDADDVILPDKIRLMLDAYLRLNNNRIVLYCNMMGGNHNNIYDTSSLRFSLDLGHNIFFSDVYKRYGVDFGITPVCFLFSRKVIESNNWNINLGPVEDMDYLLQILDNNYELQYFPFTLVIYRNTPSSYSKSLHKLYKSYYGVLSYWMVKKNSFFWSFTKRTAILYKKSIYLYLLNKSDQIYHPKFSIKLSFIQKIFVLLIYPYTFILFALELFKIIYKRISN